MLTQKSYIDTNGRLAIPAKIRQIFKLKPGERLWQHIKSNTIRNKIYDTLDILEYEVCEFIKSISDKTVSQICSVNWFN